MGRYRWVLAVVIAGLATAGPASAHDRVQAWPDVTYDADAIVMKDFTLRGAAAKLESALTANGVVHDVREYPDASHSFMNDHQPGDVPRIAVVLGTLMGARYHEESANHARERIAGFFDEHLKSVT